MAAVPEPQRDTPRRLRPMREADLDAVIRIEREAYPFPWTTGIFRDCLASAYPCRVLLDAQERIIGYGVLSVAAGEAHVLNICTAPALQRQGHGRWLLRELIALARQCRAQRLYLEVRPSNAHAWRLYEEEGFHEIGRRPRYYPAVGGREDAIVMAMELL